MRANPTFLAFTAVSFSTRPPRAPTRSVSEMSQQQLPPRERERRWTILLVPHTSEAPRSFSLSERAVRTVAWVAGVAALAAAFVVAALVLRVREADRALTVAWEAGDREVDSLRARLDSLRGSLAGIQVQESRIRAAVGVTPTDAASFWSRVLRHSQSRERAAQDQERRLTSMRDSLRREIRGVTTAADSLVVRAGEVSSRAQRMADSVASRTDARRP